MYDCCRCLNEMANRYDVCITWVPGHRDIAGNCRADDLARKSTTIELSDEFSTLGIPLGTCRLIIDNAIVDLVNSRWAASDKAWPAWKIWPKLDRRCTATQLKLQSSRLSTVNVFIIGHCIMETQARRIGLGHLHQLWRWQGGWDYSSATVHMSGIWSEAKGAPKYLLLGGSRWTTIYGYWHSESLHLKFRVVPGLGEVCETVSPWGDCHFYLHT